MRLGKLKKVDLRSEWKNEATGFTKWLSKQENLNMLGEEIGIDIQYLNSEESVGRYSVDIVAEEENSGRKIIIENQLEYTDHDHLGKIITYASGYDAEIVIWVVKDVRDEHKQAVDWLNEHTDEQINIFILKIELWQIGESQIAPKFQIVSQPNDWAKALKSGYTKGLTETKMMQLDFWNKFKEFASKSNTKLRLRKTYPQHWYDISIGMTGFHIALIVDTRNKVIRCEIYISDSKEIFHQFHSNKEKIEEMLGEKLDWMELPDSKASRIVLIKDADFTKVSEWETYFSWLLEKAESFNKVFRKYI